MDYKTANLQDILADAKERGSEAIAFLKKVSKETTKNKKGDVVPISFIALKRKYFAKFLPELLPVAKPRKKTMFDIINEL